MSRLKKMISLLMTVALVMGILPIFSIAVNVGGTVDKEEFKSLNNGVAIDTNPEGGYTGDYVVIYNPSSNYSAGVTTGSLSGLIQTSVQADMHTGGRLDTSPAIQDSDRPYIVDVDSEFGYADIDQIQSLPVRADYPVGATKNFSVTNYSPGGSSIQFKVLYVGEHCRIWTVTNSAYHPLDGINSDYARQAAETFDGKYALMNSSYGAFRDSNGDGKVNLMFYNIEDGWEPGAGYVAGYFYSYDFISNSLPMIHIDTYPGIQWESASGEVSEDLTGCYGTLMHEFQHLINYSETGGMATWLNEAFSGSAEELCFPGTGLFSRIQSWHNFYFSTISQLQNPPAEYAYNSAFDLHKGGTLAAWNNNGADIYARYAEVMLFSQYLYSYAGTTTIYKSIIDANSGSSDSAAVSAVTDTLGVTTEQLWGGFFTAMIANDPYNTSGTYGFDLNAGYNASDVYNLENVYSLLSPVIYTSTSAASVKGGGFITVKPVNGVFNPPSNASSTLRYVGITLDGSTQEYTVTFKNWDGSVLKIEAVTAGGSATPPADPVRIGYTFKGWDTGYTNIYADTVITATYEVNTHSLTIRYLYEDESEASRTYIQSYEYMEGYSVASPIIEGFTASAALIEGVMGDDDINFAVVYTADPIIVLGDANCDGVVTFTDISLIYAYIINWTSLSDEGVINADYNRDGNVTFVDVALIYSFMLSI